MALLQLEGYELQKQLHGDAKFPNEESNVKILY